MNLHAIASRIVSAVNPMIRVTITREKGYTTNADGSRVPVTYKPCSALAQIQAMTSSELQQISGLNLSGEKLAMYITGAVEDVSRPDVYGGDIITIVKDRSQWLVVQPLENWSRMGNWTKVAVVRQNA